MLVQLVGRSADHFDRANFGPNIPKCTAAIDQSGTGTDRLPAARHRSHLLRQGMVIDRARLTRRMVRARNKLCFL